MTSNNKTNKNKEKYKNNIHLKNFCYKNSNNIIVKVKIANSFLSRLMGLMFKENIEYPLLFEIDKKLNSKYASSIHSCFMRFDIVLVFIDKNHIVYEMADLNPWNFYVPKKGAKYVIEFDKKQFENINLKIGDEIELK